VDRNTEFVLLSIGGEWDSHPPVQEVEASVREPFLKEVAHVHLDQHEACVRLCAFPDVPHEQGQVFEDDGVAFVVRHAVDGSVGGIDQEVSTGGEFGESLFLRRGADLEHILHHGPEQGFGDDAVGPVEVQSGDGRRLQDEDDLRGLRHEAIPAL